MASLSGVSPALHSGSCFYSNGWWWSFLLVHCISVHFVFYANQCGCENFLS